MTASDRPGRPVAVTRLGVDNLFARGPDDTLLHVRRTPPPSARGGHGGTSLGGQLVGDPTAVVTTTGRLHVFARCRGGHLLHWVEEPGGGMTGPVDHGWRIAYDPVAVKAPNGAVAIHARGANDELVRWWLADGGPTPLAESLGGSVVATPAGVYRSGPLPDVFATGADGSLNRHGVIARTSGGGDFVGWRQVGKGLSGAPLVVSWAASRLDVLAPGTDSTGPRLLHWGFDANKGTHTEPAPGANPSDPSAERLRFTGTWFGPDTSDLGATEALACVIATEPDHALLFARDANGKLQRWRWDGGFFPSDRGWFGPEIVADEVASKPTAFVAGRDPRLYAWVGEGPTLVELTPEGDGWSSREVSIDWDTAEDQLPHLELPVDVSLLVSRPTDLLRLGVSWSGFTVADGDPPTLVPTADAVRPTLRLVLPPQHIGEEVQPETEPLGTDVDRVWQSVRSGPSQLVFDVQPASIPLTPAGVLGAVRGALLRGQDVASGEINTFVELPWQLFVSPDGATAEHPIEATDASRATVPLWRTRLRSASGDLAIRRAGGEDSFVPPLGAPHRRQLAAQSSPARFERLELSSLGGTLRAHGQWDGLDWQHDATLARDGRVRVEMRGLLYPYGHRAVFTTITERHLSDPGSPIGVLRQRSYLSVTEPTQARPVDDAEQARAFPFDDVTITTRVFEGVAAEWRTGTRPGHAPEQIVAEIQAARDQLAAMPRVVDGWTGPLALDEVAAAFVAPEGTVLARQALLADQRLAQIERIQDLEQQAEALRELDTKPVLQFFCPRVEDVWLEFPVTCRLGEQTLSFTTPMLFVADQRLPETLTQPAFDTLVDDDVQARLAKEWATIRSGRPTATAPAAGDKVLRDTDFAGVVALAGQSLDLLGTAASDDRQLLNRIYVSGQPHGREFRPRLGPATALSVPQPAWGVDVTLPSLRELLPGHPEAHRVVTTLSQAYLASGAEAAEVVHDIVGPASGTLNDAGELVDDAGTLLSQVHGIVVDFTRDAERSGGLAAPKMTADGLSRLVGPVNVGGLTSLDPARLLDQGATLLGFPLIDLLGPLKRSDIPTITTDLSGPQPIVTMSWPPIPPGTPPDQRPEQELSARGPFGPVEDPPGPTTPKPTMTLEVRTAGEDVRTECTVRNFSLSFPTHDPLLKLTFRQVRYVQEGGKPPDLKVDGLTAKFSDKLDLLKALEEKVGLGGTGPSIRVDDSGIVASYALAVPDAASGAFVMRNLLFNASVTVPFQGDPVVVGVAFGRRAKPFNLSVMMFGGGGYAEIELAHDGLRRMDIALEFGASIAVDFVMAKGEAHVLGGIRFELLPDDSVRLVGYLRIGGSLEVLGLVSVTVELVLSLGYESNGNRLVGRATLVIELDLTVYSDSVELDSGEWEIAGGDPTTRVPAELRGPEFLADRDPYLALLREHRAAFPSVSEG